MRLLEVFYKHSIRVSGFSTRLRKKFYQVSMKGLGHLAVAGWGLTQKLQYPSI